MPEAVVDVLEAIQIEEQDRQEFAAALRPLDRLLGEGDLAADLLQIDGIGDVIALSVATFLADDNNRRLLKRLEELGMRPVEPEPKAVGPLSGMTFCVTGTLTRPREEIIRSIEAQGGKVTGSVSKKTSYLVVGADVGAAKMEAATKHGVKVIEEAELAEILQK